MAQLEIKKMKQGMSYSCKEKTIILNVFKYFRIQFPDKCVTDLVRRTAKATGCSEKSIFQFRKEEASVEGFKEPSKTKIRKNININSRDIKYDNNVRQAIRNVIYDLKYHNVVPSLNTILRRVNGDSQLPNFSLMTLRRLMFDMGFYYEKSGNKSILAEKPIINKDNVPLPQGKHASKSEKTLNPAQHKAIPPPPLMPPAPSVHHSVCDVPPTNQLNSYINHQQQGIVQMPVSMHENHITAMPPTIHPPPPTSHSGMPMMLNPPPTLPSLALRPSSNIDVHIKREVPPWMHSYDMIKQH